MKATPETAGTPARSVHNSCAESTSHYSPTRPVIDTVPLIGAGHLLGYARVSTAGQDTTGQIDALNAAGCARIFVEHASGAKTERVELGKLLDQALPGDVVCVVRLDRLGRSLPHLIDTVTTLDTRGIGFRSLSENIDTTTAGGRLVFHIFGALAEFERELIRERTNAGLTAARARGRVGGRPTVMTPEKVKAAQTMYNTGDSTIAAIASVLGVSRATIYRHL